MVTIETKVWEKDWLRLIVGRLCLEIFEANILPHVRSLIINNVATADPVKAKAHELIELGHLHELHAVEESIGQALTSFNVTAESFGSGFVYSAAEIVGLTVCKTEFLCHFAGDVRLASPSNWIEAGIELLNRRPDISVVNPVWNGRREEAVSAATEVNGDFAIGYGFSDQCYLVRTEEFRHADLNQTHPDSDRYPAYGGELFEKRIDAWMRNTGRLRATYMPSSYVHPC